jgi:Na+/proline symporter
MASDSMAGLLLDGLIVFLYFAIIIAIGLYKGRGSKDLESFAVGNRNIPWWAVLASILAAEISAATFLGAPGEGYEKRNFTYAQLALGTILARVIIAYVFIKPYYDFRVVSIYEYLLLRFGVRTKDTASAIFLITRALASGTRLYVAAIVFVMGYEMITGETLTVWQQVWVYILALTVITALTALYTALGGIKAVVWTDVIQACIMFGSLGFAIWSLLRTIPGGWQAVTATLDQPEDWQFFSSGLEPERSFWDNVRGILESEYTIWAALIGSTFTTLATHGTDQDMVQRMLTAKDHHRSRLSLILSGFADLPLVLAFLFVGILLWAFYQQPGKNAPFAYYIVHELHRGLVSALPPPRGLPSSDRARGANQHCRFLGVTDSHRLRDRLRQDRAERAHHPNRPRNFRIHLWLAARSFPRGPSHQTPRERSGKPFRDDLRISGRRGSQRFAQ